MQSLYSIRWNLMFWFSKLSLDKFLLIILLISQSFQPLLIYQPLILKFPPPNPKIINSVTFS